MSSQHSKLLTARIAQGSYADRLRVAASLLDDAAHDGTSEIRGMLLSQRAALIASDVSGGLYAMLGEQLGVVRS